MKKRIHANFLGGTMYAPFARTLSVDISQWDKDFENMQRMGFTCVHGFAEWHDIEYNKGVFDFSAIDHMVACANRHGIVSIINIATQNNVAVYSPRWLMNECAGSETIDAKGGKNPEGLYMVPCLDDPLYIQYAHRYLNEVAKHFANMPGVGGYVLWGEPALFRAGSNSSICFCKHTVDRFRKWLKEKYKTIDALNNAWSTEGPADFENFSEVKPPRGSGRQMGGYASWADWRNFTADNMCSHIKDADTIMKRNGATQPTIVEMDYNFGREWSCNQWKVAACADIVGVSTFQRPGRSVSNVMWAADSMAKMQNKSMFVVECPGGSTIMSSTPTVPHYEEIQSTMIQRAANGAAGAMYWCYRPRMSDLEGGDFGLVMKSGRPTYRAVAGGEITHLLSQQSALLGKLTRKSDVAIYVSSEINNLTSADSILQEYRADLRGAHLVMEDLHINADYINDGFITHIHKYKVLILPFAYILNETVTAEIDRFVQNGGVVIGDYIVGFKRPNGVCYYDLLECGLANTFGIAELDPILARSEVPFPEYGITYRSRICEPYLTTAQPLEVYEGIPVLTKNTYGQGAGYYFASPVFGAYTNTFDKRIRNTIQQILKQCNVTDEISLEISDGMDKSNCITSQMSGENGERMYTVLNETDTAVEDVVMLPCGNYTDLRGIPYSVIEHDNCVLIPLSLKAMETAVFILDASSQPESNS